MILLPLFALSGILAYFLIKQIEKEDKMKQKKGMCQLLEKIIFHYITESYIATLVSLLVTHKNVHISLFSVTKSIYRAKKF